MSSGRVWVLGPSGPEIDAIERILRSCGADVRYALHNGVRCDPSNAYEATGFSSEYGEQIAGSTYGVGVPTLCLVGCGGVPNRAIPCDGEEGQFWPEVSIPARIEEFAGIGGDE